jgi:ribosomal protein L29
MAILKSKEIAKMNEKDINEKINELRKEMVKAKITIKKAGKANLREIKRTIARLLTFKNRLNREKSRGASKKQ